MIIIKMDPRQLSIDERLTGFCGYCGQLPNSRDHIPSRVLLDEPYPTNLPVIEVCKKCNESFSQDEEYVACLIECVIFGTTKPDSIEREKIKRILSERASLTKRINGSRIEDAEGDISWQIEPERLKKVVLKLARGHLAYELNIFHFEEPNFLEIVPFIRMSEKESLSFNSVSSDNLLLPELGSRAFISMFKKLNFEWNSWRIVQENRYRYRVEQGHNGDKVQFVLSEYLACTVIWT